MPTPEERDTMNDLLDSFRMEYEWREEQWLKCDHPYEDMEYGPIRRNEAYGMYQNLYCRKCGFSWKD